MFLLCNGILVILVKSSFSWPPLTPQDHHDHQRLVELGSDRKLVIESQKQSIVVADEVAALSTVDVHDQDDDNDHDDPSYHLVQQRLLELGNDRKLVSELQEKSIVVADEIKAFSTVKGNVWEFFYNHDDDDDHSEEQEDKETDLATEELNKRCEDFIRWMKQGIISESRKDNGLTRFS